MTGAIPAPARTASVKLRRGITPKSINVCIVPEIYPPRLGSKESPSAEAIVLANKDLLMPSTPPAFILFQRVAP